MTSKLWIFGDSFSTGRDSTHTTWTNILASELNAELKITAVGGSSLGWIMYQSMLHRNLFGADDFVIFQTTSPSRAFLDKTKPGLAEYQKERSDWNLLTDEQRAGYQFYLDNIHDEEILLLQLQSWIWGMDHYTSHLTHKPIIMYAWDLGNLEVPIGWKNSKGTLLYESMAEFSGEYQQSINWMVDNAGDPRDNHFSITNHKIIANMLKRALLENYVPDFNNLEKNLYSKYPTVGNESWSKEWIV